jgi:hypothetical protein
LTAQIQPKRAERAPRGEPGSQPTGSSCRFMKDF